MTEAEYCLNHCPFPDHDGCSPCCEIYSRDQRGGSRKKYVPQTDRKRPPSDFQRRKAEGMALLLDGVSKRAVVDRLEVSYSSVQRWEAQLIREGKFKKPRDMRIQPKEAIPSDD